MKGSDNTTGTFMLYNILIFFLPFTQYKTEPLPHQDRGLRIKVVAKTYEGRIKVDIMTIWRIDNG